MSRKVDDKKTKRTLRRLARARREAESRANTNEDERPEALSDWEGEFLDSLEDRLETFGSAFADPDKGALDEPLSNRQSAKLREIEKKAKGKGRKAMRRGNGFKRKSPDYKSRSRDINEDLIEPAETPPADRASGVDPASEPDADAAPSSASRPDPTQRPSPAFRIIDGGKPD